MEGDVNSPDEPVQPLYAVMVVYPPERISLDERRDYEERYGIFLARCAEHPVLSSSEWKVSASSWSFRLPEHEAVLAYVAQQATAFGLRYWQEYFDEDPLRYSD
jgi:hypothetical protein